MNSLKDVVATVLHNVEDEFHGFPPEFVNELVVSDKPMTRKGKETVAHVVSLGKAVPLIECPRDLSGVNVDGVKIEKSESFSIPQLSCGRDVRYYLHKDVGAKDWEPFIATVRSLERKAREKNESCCLMSPEIEQRLVGAGQNKARITKMEKNKSNCNCLDEETASLIEQWRAAAPRPMGLNPFLIASEGDMSETAHSYALKEFLNPDRMDGLYMRKFIDFLHSVASGRKKKRLAEELKGISPKDAVTVSAEVPTVFHDSKSSKPKKGRIDVLIEAEDKSWAIIVENKIKGAPDMPRQLFRYVKGNTGKDGHQLNVKAVVYLKANSDNVECPARGEDREVVVPLFLPIAAFKADEKGNVKSLEVGWLKKLLECDETVPNEDKTVINQYINVIARLREVLVQDEIYCRILECCDKTSVTIESLPEDVKSELGKVLARRVAFQSMRGEFSSLEVYRRNPAVAVYDSLKLCIDNNGEKYIGLKLDVNCDKVIRDGKIRLRLFSEKCCCTDEMGKYIGKALPALGKIVKDCAGNEDSIECVSENNTGYDFTIDPSLINWRVSEIVKRISAFVENLADRKEDMEKTVNDMVLKL